MLSRNHFLYLCFLLFGVSLQSCKNKTEEKTKKQAPITTPYQAEKAWIKSSIERFFNNNQNDFKALCTAEYYTYKTDATNVGMDGGMNEEDFYTKWNEKFDTKYAGEGVGFMIPSQDHGQIEVTSCEVDDVSNPVSYDVIISDLNAKVDYKRKIKLSKENNQFKIADVLELE